jgi:protein-disulfide isomerase
MTKTLNADRTLSVISMVATLVALGIIIEGRMTRSSAGVARPEIKKVASWTEKSSPARAPLHAAVRPVQVDVFTDFQCPFCRLMDSTLNRLEATFPGKLSRAIVHFPLA